MSQQPTGKKKRGLHASTLHVLAAVLVLALTGITATFCAAWAQRQDHIEKEASTDVFKTFDLETLDGGRFSANDLQSTALTAVNAWGTDCPPCIKELPDLEALNNSYDDSVFRIIGVPVDVTNRGQEIIPDRLEEAERIIGAAGVTFINIIPDEKMSVFLKGTMIGTPTTYFLDSEGNIVETVTGSRSDEDWKTIVTDLVKERTGK